MDIELFQYTCSPVRLIYMSLYEYRAREIYFSICIIIDIFFFFIIIIIIIIIIITIIIIIIIIIVVVVVVVAEVVAKAVLVEIVV